MPFALILVGIVLLVSAVRNTSSDLYTLVKGDFTGTDNFAYWLVSILIIGALGYIEPLKPISRVFLALIVIVLLIAHRGVFAQFNAQVFQSSASTIPTTNVSAAQTANQSESTQLNNELQALQNLAP
jgi:hypothetical protein